MLSRIGIKLRPVVFRVSVTRRRAFAKDKDAIPLFNGAPPRKVPTISPQWPALTDAERIQALERQFAELQIAFHSLRACVGEEVADLEDRMECVEWRLADLEQGQPV